MHGQSRLVHCLIQISHSELTKYEIFALYYVHAIEIISMWSEPLRDLRAPLTRHTAPRHAPGVAKASSSPRPWPGTAPARNFPAERSHGSKR